MKQVIDLSDNFRRDQLTAYVGFVDSDFGLVTSYKNAVEMIFNQLQESMLPVDVVAHPVLYLMRHSLELGYKANFAYLKKYSNRQTTSQILRSHNLQVLHEELRTHFDIIAERLMIDLKLISVFNERFLDVSSLLIELEQSEVSAFRYVDNTKGDKIFNHRITKDLGQIFDKYQSALQMILYTADLIAPATNYEDLISIRPRYKLSIKSVLFSFNVVEKPVYVTYLNERYEKLDRLQWRAAEDILLSIVRVRDVCYLVVLK